MVYTDKILEYIEKFNANDNETQKQAIDNSHAAKWLLENIPVFVCPDKTIEETYYFRWWVYRKHIKHTPEGYIITEFHPDVPWAGVYNSINGSADHHIAEGRWLKNNQDYLPDYIRFLLKGKGNAYSYSSAIIDSVYNYCATIGDFALAIELLDEFAAFYRQVEYTNWTQYGLFWSYDDRDAMEMSISGSGLRPTLNSYMYANAAAISKIADKAGQNVLADQYDKKAKTLKETMLRLLWDKNGNFFKVIPQGQRQDEIPLEFDRISAQRNVRELIGYIPWSFGIPEKEHGSAWKYLMDDSYFHAPFGPTTAEKQNPEYLLPCDSHECLWNGPSWPFATTQTLNSAIRFLKSGSNSYLKNEDLLRLMNGYAKSHYRTLPDGSRINWLDENLHPETGEWLSRNILENWGWPKEKGGYERGKDYNHSTFCDLVIRGIVGITVSEGESLMIDPLLPDEEWLYFMLNNVYYKGKKLDIVYDRTGEAYGRGRGLQVFVDDLLAGSRENIGSIYIKIT